jgi:hypothetical protein
MALATPELNPYMGVSGAVGKYSAALHARSVADMKQVWHPR